MCYTCLFFLMAIVPFLPLDCSSIGDCAGFVMANNELCGSIALQALWASDIRCSSSSSSSSSSRRCRWQACNCKWLWYIVVAVEGYWSPSPTCFVSIRTCNIDIRIDSPCSSLLLFIYLFIFALTLFPSLPEWQVIWFDEGCQGDESGPAVGVCALCPLGQA